MPIHDTRMVASICHPRPAGSPADQTGRDGDVRECDVGMLEYRPVVLLVAVVDEV